MNSQPRVSSHANTTDTIGGRLRSARVHVHMSAADATAFADISERRLTAMELGTGAVPDPVVLQHLAHAYGVSALWLRHGSAAGSKFIPIWYLPPTAGGAA